MIRKLCKISNEEYAEKENSAVIDGVTDKDNRFTINKFLSKERRKTKVYLIRPNSSIVTGSFIKINDIYKIYDHMKDFRLPLYAEQPKSIRCTFSTPYNHVAELAEHIKEPWINHEYKIYLVNPRLYRYYQPNTLTLAHVEDLDSKYFKGKTDYCVSCINDYMVEETGEPLFYLI